MINSITFELVAQHQQELRRDAANQSLARRVRHPRRAGWATIASRWSRRRRAPAEQPNVEHLPAPATSRAA